jgi:hypothetical protein
VLDGQLGVDRDLLSLRRRELPLDAPEDHLDQRWSQAIVELCDEQGRFSSPARWALNTK